MTSNSLIASLRQEDWRWQWIPVFILKHEKNPLLRYIFGKYWPTSTMNPFGLEFLASALNTAKGLKQGLFQYPEVQDADLVSLFVHHSCEKKKKFSLHSLLVFQKENELTCAMKALMWESSHINQLSLSLIPLPCFRARTGLWLPQQPQCRPRNKDFHLFKWFFAILISWIRSTLLKVQFRAIFTLQQIPNIVPVTPPPVLIQKHEQHPVESSLHASTLPPSV